MQQEAQSSALFSRFPVSVIPLGLDTEVYMPRNGAGLKGALGIPESSKVILFAADSLANTRKGCAELLQALSMFDVDDDLFLLTVGGNEPKLNGAFSHIHLGYINSDYLMSTIYSAADVFVSPSLQEAFGQTALEAMACGTPVVGFSVGGILDTVRPGETGYLAALGDVRELSEGILSLLKNPDQCRILGNNARHMVENEYSLEIMAKRYVSLYSMMMNKT